MKYKIDEMISINNTEWRIASHNDFSNLYSHAASLLKSLKLTTTFSPFHLIAGNPTDEMLLKKAKWNMKVVDIYNLNIFPYTYYTGFIELLGDEDYIEYFSSFDESGNVVVTHISPDNKLPEIIELKNHPWFIGVQFHPEFKSRPLAPHPLFSSFIKAAKNHK